MLSIPRHCNLYIDNPILLFQDILIILNPPVTSKRTLTSTISLTPIRNSLDSDWLMVSPRGRGSVNFCFILAWITWLPQWVSRLERFQTQLEEFLKSKHYTLFRPNGPNLLISASCWPLSFRDGLHPPLCRLLGRGHDGAGQKVTNSRFYVCWCWENTWILLGKDEGV